MQSDNISFDKLIPSDEQINTLYALLTARKHIISHNHLPSFEQHELFVRKHPYRAWYLINAGTTAIGSFYVSKQNTIGINIIDLESEELVSKILNYVHASYAPLKAISSVRGGAFSVNVSPTNSFLLGAMDKLGAKVVQVSFIAPKPK
jgi:hypothetical protein